MSSRPSTTTADAGASSALGAFLRGVERRGLVFAHLLAGSREAGADGLDWAVDRFRDEAGLTAFGDWPRRFWSLLLAAPTLRRPPANARWDAGFAWLARIGHGPRAALLLRLVAGLAESDAAGVLGIARSTYRLGLQRALPHRDDGSADVDAWQALGRAAQEAVRALPPGGPATSTRADPGSGDGSQTRAPGRRPIGHGIRAALALVALATLAALATTFVAGDHLPAGLDDAPGHILSEPLPDAERPAGRYSDGDALALHPDLGLLLDGIEPGGAAGDPAFHAWLATEGEAVADVGAISGNDGGARLVPVAHAASAEARQEPSRRPPAERLAALDEAGRTRAGQLRQRWDALPFAERGERRERWLAWNDLTRGERAQLHDAAARHALRTPEQQAALRARFDALDGSVRHGWLLGPDLGADYGRLHPLIAQVPAEARTALLEALRGLDAQGRDDLAVLAARTPPQSRAELRIELLATPAAQRARWLRRRVAPGDDAGRQ